MLRNFAYGGLALIGGGITGIVISSWATPLVSPPIAPEVTRVASIAEPAMTLASTTSRVTQDATDCSPWEVSDVAMEAALNQMIRRGWRPPTQAEVAGFSGATALEPGAFVPVRSGPPVASDDANGTDTTEPFPVDQIAPVGVPPVDTTTPAEAPAPAAPPPAPVIEIPTPPAN